MRIFAQSAETREVNLLFSGLQVYFVSKLNALALQFGEGKACKSVTWECDKGAHGRGKNYEARDTSLFDHASVQVSDIYDEDTKNVALEYVSVFSTTIHPNNPHVPSVHFAVSRVKMKGGEAYWKLIADFNPSILNEAALDKNIFSDAVEQAAGELYEEGKEQGDAYFYIPEVGRHRGVSHYYLDNYSTGNFDEEKAFIRAFYESVMHCYLKIFSSKLMMQPTYTQEKKDEQLAYFTLYLFQILIGDRDTREALLECDQNALSVLASLPSAINRDILSAWAEKMPAPADLLLKDILKKLPKLVPTPVDAKFKKQLAKILRKYYTTYPTER